MSENGGTCQYVLDPNDPETWKGNERGNPQGAEPLVPEENKCRVDDAVLNEDGVWACPHAAEERDGLCIFHLPLAEKDETQVFDAFVDVVESRHEDDTAERDQARQFLGATFGHIDLGSYDGMKRVPGDLRLSYADIEGAVDFSGVVFEGDVSFAGATFRPEPSASARETAVSFERATFTADADFTDATFGTTGDFRGATFEARAEFAGVSSEVLLGFNKATFEGITMFNRAVFKRDVGFSRATFRDTVDFSRSTFADAATPDGTWQFEPSAQFEGTTFGGRAGFNGSTFEVETDFTFSTFEGKADFSFTSFSADANFNNVGFGSDADFGASAFAAAAKFKETSFNGTGNFAGVTLSDQNFHGADLTDADFKNATLHRADFESALLSRATLFGADLRGARLSGAVMGDVRVDEGTQFLGHPSDDAESPHTISAIRSRQPCIYDPAYQDDEHADADTAKTVYRALEELGRRTGRSRLQARCFVRRQDLQKSGYWDDATAADATAEERLVAGARWWRSAVARTILLYGESPWRVIGYSFLTVFGFALLYPLGGWMRPAGDDPVRYDGLASLAELGNSLYYSTLTFTALGFGDFQPVGFGRVLTTIETSLGAVLLALLVFILGRRAAR